LFWAFLDRRQVAAAIRLVVLTIAVALTPTIASGMVGLPPPLDYEGSRAVTWREMTGQADAIAARQPLSIDFSPNGPGLDLESMSDEFFTALQDLPSSADICAFAATYLDQADAAIWRLNRAIRARIGTGSAELDPPPGSSDTFLWRFDNASAPLTPWSQDWEALPPSDLRLVRMVGRVNIAWLDLHDVADSFVRCDDEDTIHIGSTFAQPLDRLVLYYLVHGDDRAEGIMADLQFREQQEEEVDGHRATGELRCNDLISDDLDAVVSRLTSYRNLQDTTGRSAMLEMLNGARVWGQSNWLDRILPRFPKAVAIEAECASLYWSDLPPSIRSIDIWRSNVDDLELSGFKGDSVRVTRSEVGNINLERASLSGNLLVEDSSTSDIRLVGASIEGDVSVFRSTVRGGIEARDAEIMGSFNAGRLELYEDIDLTGLEADSVGINDVYGKPYEYDTTGDLPTISAYGARVEEEFGVVRVSNLESVFLGRIKAGVVRLTDLRLAGDVNLWGATAEVLFLNEIRTPGQLTMWYVQAGAVQLADSNLAGVVMPYATVRTLVSIRRLSTHSMDMYNLSAGEFILNCARVADSIDLGYSHVRQSVALRQVQADSILMRAAQTAELVVFPYNDNGGETAATDVDNTPVFARDLCVVSAGLKTAEFRGAQIDAIEITGRIASALILNDVTAGRVMLRGERLDFGRDAVVLARNAEIGVFSIAATGLVSTDGSPVALDLEGSTIGLLKPHSPILDEGRVETISEELGMLALNEAAYRRFYLSTVVNALNEPVKFSVEEKAYQQGPGYPGAAFRLLRSSALAAGYPSIAKDIAVLQNERYGAQLPASQFLLKGIYFIGGAINQYGYDNMIAVAWLVLLWIAGVGVLNADLFVYTYEGIVRRLRRIQGPRRPSPRFNFRGLFFSIDRTVPALGLDNAFSSTAEIRNWQAACIYLQRILSFVVILFMIGGALNFFQ
jgi:hypothetical protein